MVYSVSKRGYHKSNLQHLGVLANHRDKSYSSSCAVDCSTAAVLPGLPSAAPIIMIRSLGMLTAILTNFAMGPAQAQPPAPLARTLDLTFKPPAITTSIRVGTKDLPPFVFTQTDASLQSDVPPYGYSIDLWQEIAGDLDLETEWITYQSVSDLLAGVQTGEIDVAIAGISVTAQREAQGLDFSYPFYQSGLQLLVKRPTSTAATAASAVLQWHHLRPILLIFGSSTVVGGLIWLVERKHNEGFSGDVVQGVSQGIWFAIVTLGTFGYGDVTPTKFAGRLIATLWMGLSFFIVADFIASLTVQQLSESDVSLESLWGKPVGAISGTTGAIFLQSQPVKLMVYPDFDTAIAALESGTVAGVVQDAPTLKHFVNLHPNRFELVGDLLTNEGYGIAVRENNMDLLEAVDQKILKYQQLGFLQQLHQKWFQAGTPAEIEP